MQLIQNRSLASCIQSKHDHLSRGTPALVHRRRRLCAEKAVQQCKNLSYPHFFVPEDSVQHLTHGVSHFAPRILGLKPLGCLGQGLRVAFSALWEALCGSNQTIEAAQPPFMVLEDHHLPTINLSCKMHLRKRCPTSMKDNGTF